ncbi:LytTR family DNA-binding domain-containing protein [Bifidobacterium sp. ESL0682]|uniref:LytR/AlgR family response regulator transcription factor n=1 Tax=Bifidobacterium sp. ESL0682 TaxID=2983212 RepID=UPI0023F9F153|nr:LytTR family DNA-binding domain-containing protein [Bifidobacterium sp. ESL0682]WEV42026.1 LytTR family DNA-binding domain-containing protein [Bifidobacterium sp. ESL0682]
MLVTVAVIEDDPSAANHLKNCLNQFSENPGNEDIEFKVTEFTEPTAFLDPYKACYDIVFMDIELPNMDGMEAARRLRTIDKHTILIFVTNMSQFAAKGYEVDALDYIIKPFSYTDFEHKLSRAVNLCRKSSQTIAITQRSDTRIIRLQDLSYIEVKGHTLVFHTESADLTGTGSLTDIAKKLDGQGFLRNGKSYLVNQRFIEQVHGSTITMTGGTQLPIGRSYHKTFLTQLAQSLGNDHVL